MRYLIMEMIGKIETEGYLRICDLSVGECFCFLDNNELCMTLDDEDTYLNFTDNRTYDIYGSDAKERPIKRVKAKIIIEG